MRKFRTKNITLLLLTMLLLLTVGYAALSTTLKINGTVDVSRTSWDVHFENVDITSGSVTASPAPTTDGETTTEMAYTINFTKPGDFYEFTVDMVNDGTIDAMVDLVDNNAYATAASTTPIPLPSYLTSSTTYDDGVPIVQNQILAHNTSEKIKVRIEFKKDIQASDLPNSGATTVVFKFKGQYKQADENACPIRVDFATDSWDNIISLYKSGNKKSLETAMINGTTREVELDLDNDPETAPAVAHLRIANLSTPAECKTTGFSQTACGFVLEFADVISNHEMNTTNTNAGGWPACDMRTYLNDETLENVSLYNALPSELSSKIITTYVVSGHGDNQGETNFTSTDKIYLLSPMEVWKNNSFSQYDTARDLSRQLDYYNVKEVSDSNYSNAIKIKKNGSGAYWWLRSAHIQTDFDYNGVSNTGIPTIPNVGAITVAGVSPAFRIASEDN